MKKNIINESEQMERIIYNPVNFKKTDYIKFRAKETEIIKKYGLTKTKKGELK